VHDPGLVNVCAWKLTASAAGTVDHQAAVIVPPLLRPPSASTFHGADAAKSAVIVCSDLRGSPVLI
jgi:hypothetical protein